MRYNFTARIYKVGINPCVDVPAAITRQLTARGGYIPITGSINSHNFQQNLVPVKGALYRLYVNGLMMTGGNVQVGDKASFEIMLDSAPPKKVPMPSFLKKRLISEGLFEKFRELTPSRQKEVNRYLNSLKSTEAKDRNVERVVKMLQAGEKSLW